MITSKDVFSKRRDGALDEAYQMAIELVSRPGADAWDYKALAWCCVDLIKRDATAGSPRDIDGYRAHLEKVDATDDEILSKQIQFVLSLCTPSGTEMAKARSLSKSGKHLEAAAIYRKLIAAGAPDADAHNGLAWELYRLAKSLMALPGDATQRVKPLLQEYLRLRVERPSSTPACCKAPPRSLLTASSTWPSSRRCGVCSILGTRITRGSKGKTARATRH
jgi:hypothetical protein